MFGVQRLNQIQYFDDFSTLKITEPIKLLFKIEKQQNVAASCLACKDYCHLTWANLSKFGTEEQKTRFNDFRLSIQDTFLNELMTICNNAKFCEVELTGTKTNITYSSDIDINLSIILPKDKVSSDVFKTFLEVVNKVYDTTDKFFKERFEDSYSKLFDMNIYATKFSIDKMGIACEELICSDVNQSNQSQMEWAFMRAAEVIEKSNLSIAKLPANIQNLYHATLAKRNTFLEQINTSKERLQIYVEKIKSFYSQENRSIDEYMEAFSISKYFEDETYRSVGAFLDVVVLKLQGKRMHRSFYIDSFLDNYGFLLENLMMPDIQKCMLPDISIRLLRVCKYMERMCDAVLNYYGQIGMDRNVKELFENLRKLCNDINLLRKKDPNDTNISIKLNEVFNIIAPYVTFDKQGRIVNDPTEWYDKINTFFLRTIPIEIRMSKGGHKNKIFILGRHRVITKEGRTNYITYQKKKITLTEARKLDKKHSK